MLCLFTSDLHSRTAHFNRLFELYQKHNVDAIIIGGDLFEYTHYVEEQLSFLENFLKDFLCSISVPIIILPGNTDWPFSIRRLEESMLPKVRVISSNKPVIINGIKLIGYEYITPPPFSQKHRVKRDLMKDNFVIDRKSYITNSNGDVIIVEKNFLNTLTSVEEDLEELFSTDSIWITHNPPYGGNLDITYDNIHVGSKALMKKIVDLQPKLVLSGHIHESPFMSSNWVDRIGNSICINPGYSDEFHGVLFEIDNNIDLKYLEHTIYGRYNSI